MKFTFPRVSHALMVRGLFPYPTTPTGLDARFHVMCMDAVTPEAATVIADEQEFALNAPVGIAVFPAATGPHPVPSALAYVPAVHPLILKPVPVVITPLA